MEGYEVLVTTPTRSLGLHQVPTLQVAKLVAHAAGYFDVDVEPMEPGRVRVTAYGPGNKIIVTGTTVHDASDKLVNLLADKFHE